MKLKPGIKYVYETKDGETRIFKARKVEGEDAQVFNVSAVIAEGYTSIVEKGGKVIGIKDGVETEIDVSKFLA